MDQPPMESLEPVPAKKRRWLPVVIGVAVCLLVAAALAGGVILYLRSHRSAPSLPPASSTDTTTAAPPPNTVRVTVPEGYTVDEIAALLEQSGVCAAADFYQAVQTADISAYAFAADLPADAEGRAFRLEGYLFPDTYEFYLNCSGEAALRRFLDNFENRLAPYTEQLGNRSLDDVVTFASIVQAEVGYAQDMKRVARVLQNRLDNPAEYPKLQCDTGWGYLKKLQASPSGVTFDKDAYDMYTCRGLPVGAIGNPGLAALLAALSPSDEEEVEGCYFFATDYTTGITYYSKTYAQHMAVCREHSIGVHAD